MEDILYFWRTTAILLEKYQCLSNLKDRLHFCEMSSINEQNREVLFIYGGRPLFLEDDSNSTEKYLCLSNLKDIFGSLQIIQLYTHI